MEGYYNRYGTYLIPNCGWYNGGQGWFGYEDGSAYTTAVSRVLFNEGLIGRELVDDPMARQNQPRYMIYVSSNGKEYSVSTTLENPTQDDIDHAYHSFNGGHDNPNCTDVPGAQAGGGGACNAIVGRYGKNYAVPKYYK
jgi:hypothetical protein